MHVAYACEMCGYSGYTDDRQSYERGETACPQCGSHQWLVGDPEDVGYFDDDREVAQGGPAITNNWGSGAE